MTTRSEDAKATLVRYLDAKATLVYYLQTVWEKAGLKWNAENTAEVEDAIDSLIAAAMKPEDRR